MDCKINPDFFRGFFSLFIWTYTSAEVLNYLWDTLCFQRMTSLGMNSKAGCIAGVCVQLLGYQEKFSKLVTIFLTGRWDELSHSSNFLAAISEQGSWKSHSALPSLSGASLCKKSIATSGMKFRGMESLEEKKMAFSVWFTWHLGSTDQSDVAGGFKDFPEEYIIHFPKDQAQSGSCL